MFSYDEAVTTCDENGGKLAVISNQKEADVVHDYIRHTAPMSIQSTIYVWTSNLQNEMGDLSWASGYPRSKPAYHKILWRVSFDEFFSDTDGFMNAPKHLDGYPLCQMQMTTHGNGSDPIQWVERPSDENCSDDSEVEIPAHCGLGLSDHRIPDENITANSIYSSFAAKHARFSDKKLSWAGAGSNTYLQIDLGSPDTKISGLIMKGAPQHTYYVKTFKVMYGNTASTMKYIEDKNGVEIFQGNHINNEERIVFFEEILTAKLFRIVPVTFTSYPAIRMELLTPTDLASDEGRSLPAKAVCVLDKSKLPVITDPCDEMFMAQCGVGMIDGRITDDQITAINYYSGSYYPKYAKLHEKSSGWMRKSGTDPWIQIDLKSSIEVSGLMIRGGLGYVHWVTTFKIQFGDDASELKYIEDLNGVEIFGANVDSVHTRTVYFDDVIKARFIRLIPITYVDYPTLRMEILTPTDLLNRETMASLPAKSVCTFGNALLHIDE